MSNAFVNQVFDFDKYEVKSKKKHKAASNGTSNHTINQDDGRVRIQVTGNFRQMLQQSIDAVAEHSQRIYTQRGSIVEVQKRKNGSLMVRPVSRNRMKVVLSECAYYYTTSAKEDGVEIEKHPQITLADAILDGCVVGNLPFKELRGITQTPILHEDGSIVSTAGYDIVTGWYYDPVSPFSDVPDHPTLAQVHESIAFIFEQWLADFPFVEQADRATMLAALLTVVVKPYLDAVIPLILVDAPKAGSGKTLLCRLIGMVVTGGKVPTDTACQDETEWRKKILSWLIPDPEIIIIDNVRGRLESSALESVLTNKIHRDRVLGVSRSEEVENNAVWFASGNNIRVGDEMARRCIHMKLDANVELPDRRTGFRIPNILKWTMENRNLILHHLFTVVRYWIQQDSPKYSGTPLGSFEEWTQAIGGILDCIGFQGFLGNLFSSTGSRILDDSTSDEWIPFLATVARAFPDKPFTMSALAAAIKGSVKEISKEVSGELSDLLPDQFSKSYDSAVRDPSGVKAFAKHLGNAFRTKKQQIFGRYKLVESGKDRTNKTEWQLVPTSKVKPAVEQSQPAVEQSQPAVTVAPHNQERIIMSQPAVEQSQHAVEQSQPAVERKEAKKKSTKKSRKAEKNAVQATLYDDTEDFEDMVEKLYPQEGDA